MAELHVTGIDDDVLARLREQAQEEGTSLEAQIRSILEQSVRAGDGPSDQDDSSDQAETLRMPRSDRSFRTVDPVDAPGISASELLIRDRRRR